MWKQYCKSEGLSTKNYFRTSIFEIRVFEVSWYNGVDENNLKCLENPRLFTRTPWFICSCQQCCVEISFRWNFLNRSRRKRQFPAPRNMNIWKVFAPRHVWIFSDGREKTRIAYSIIRGIRIDTTTPVQHRGGAFGSRWTIVSAKGNGRWRLAIIFIRDALSNPLYLAFSRKNAAEISRSSILSLSLPSTSK